MNMRYALTLSHKIRTTAKIAEIAYYKYVADINVNDYDEVNAAIDCFAVIVERLQELAALSAIADGMSSPDEFNSIPTTERVSPE